MFDPSSKGEHALTWFSTLDETDNLGMKAVTVSYSLDIPVPSP